MKPPPGGGVRPLAAGSDKTGGVRAPLSRVPKQLRLLPEFSPQQWASLLAETRGGSPWDWLEVASRITAEREREVLDRCPVLRTRLRFIHAAIASVEEML